MYKSYDNVSFCYCTEINSIMIDLKKDVVPKKYEYEVDEELGGGELSLFACLGVGNRQKKKISNSRGYSGRGAW